jgi:hypothetical protein
MRCVKLGSTENNDSAKMNGTELEDVWANVLVFVVHNRTLVSCEETSENFTVLFCHHFVHT